MFGRTIVFGGWSYLIIILSCNPNTNTKYLHAFLTQQQRRQRIRQHKCYTSRQSYHYSSLSTYRQPCRFMIHNNNDDDNDNGEYDEGYTKRLMLLLRQLQRRQKSSDMTLYSSRRHHNHHYPLFDIVRPYANNNSNNSNNNNKNRAFLSSIATLPTERRYIKINARKHDGDDGSIPLVETPPSLLSPLLQPDIVSYTTVLETLTRPKRRRRGSGGGVNDDENWMSVSRADKMLHQMVELYIKGKSDVEPDGNCFKIVIRAYARLAKQHQREKRRRDAAERAEAILKNMEQLHIDGQLSTKPAIELYGICLNAWANTVITKKEQRNDNNVDEYDDDTAERAEVLLHTMEQMYNNHRGADEEDTTATTTTNNNTKPSIMSYRMVIDAYISRNGAISDGDMEKAEDILTKMEQMHVSDRLLNSHNSTKERDAIITIYGKIINGWSRRNKPHRAEMCLRRMISYNSSVTPDSYCFTTVMNSWSNSSSSLSSSEQIFNRTATLFSLAIDSLQPEQPHRELTTTFLHIIAKHGGRRRASRSRRILQWMMNREELESRPTIASYNAVLMACCCYCGDDDDVPKEETIKAKAFEYAITTFNDLRKDDNVHPNSLTYTTLLRACRVLLLPSDETNKRSSSAAVAKATFEQCKKDGLVDETVVEELKKVIPEEWTTLAGFHNMEVTEEGGIPKVWRRNVVV